jgi:hypothetical protein
VLAAGASSKNNARQADDTVSREGSIHRLSV